MPTVQLPNGYCRFRCSASNAKECGEIIQLYNFCRKSINQSIT